MTLVVERDSKTGMRYPGDSEPVLDIHDLLDGLWPSGACFQASLNRLAEEYRAGLVVSSNPDIEDPYNNSEPFRMAIGQEYWWGLSVFVPPDFEPDMEGYEEIILQGQASPDPGEAYRQPVFDLEIDGEDWVVKVRWDVREFTPADDGTLMPHGVRVYSEPLGDSIGSRTDWAFNARWAPDETGYLGVYRNRELVAEYFGPNCSNDELGIFVSLGLYKWAWKEVYPSYDPRVDYCTIWLGALRIGDADSYYDEVMPSAVVPEPEPEPEPARMVVRVIGDLAYPKVFINDWQVPAGFVEFERGPTVILRLEPDELIVEAVEMKPDEEP